MKDINNATDEEVAEALDHIQDEVAGYMNPFRQSVGSFHNSAYIKLVVEKAAQIIRRKNSDK